MVVVVARSGTTDEAAEGAIPARLLGLYRAGEQRYGVPWNVLGGHQRRRDGLRAQPRGVVGGRGRVDAVHALDLGAPTGWTATTTARGTPMESRGRDPGRRPLPEGSGSDRDLHDAIFAYNHAGTYVQDVLAHARMAAQGNFTVLDGTPVTDTGRRAVGCERSGYPLAGPGR